MIITDRNGRPIVPGAPSRVPNQLEPTSAPLTQIPNATRYQRQVGSNVRPQPVVEMNRFPSLTTLNFTVGVTSLLAITKPDQFRVIFIARNDAVNSPAGSHLYIAFGQPASAFNSVYDLTPGGIVQVDQVIPQDDIWIAGSVGGVVAILGYANTTVQIGQNLFTATAAQ